MAVNHRRLAAVFGGPVVADRQPELICLARRFAVQAKLANSTRAAPVHLLAEARVRYDEFPAIEHVVAHQSIQERCDLRRCLAAQRLHLRNRLFQAVFDLHLLAAEPAHELHIVVARDAERRSRRHHIANDAESIENMRSAIHKIAEEDRPPARRVSPTLVAPGLVLIR